MEVKEVSLVPTEVVVSPLLKKELRVGSPSRDEDDGVVLDVPPPDPPLPKKEKRAGSPSRESPNNDVLLSAAGCFCTGDDWFIELGCPELFGEVLLCPGDSMLGVRLLEV